METNISVLFTFSYFLQFLFWKSCKHEHSLSFCSHVNSFGFENPITRVKLFLKVSGSLFLDKS